MADGVAMRKISRHFSAFTPTGPRPGARHIPPASPQATLSAPDSVQCTQTKDTSLSYTAAAEPGTMQRRHRAGWQARQTAVRSVTHAVSSLELSVEKWIDSLALARGLPLAFAPDG